MESILLGSIHLGSEYSGSNSFNSVFSDIFIFRYIAEYIESQDLKSLCDTCKPCAEFKKYLMYILTKQYSLLFYSNTLFRDLVLSKIFNPIKQLHLNLSNCFNITDVSALGNVHTLDLTCCRNITDVSSLGNVHTLNLSYSDNITNVSSLGNVHTLDLSYCSKITDVSALGNVHTLNLSDCDNITDVSALGNVHTLDLRGCINITNVSALGNVHSLLYP